MPRATIAAAAAAAAAVAAAAVSAPAPAVISAAVADSTAAFPSDARLDAPWPRACTGAEGAVNQTRCPEGQTCCQSMYSQSGQGCCPWANAVCCANSLTCCPSGTKCVDTLPQGWPSWGKVTSCEPVGAIGGGANAISGDTRKRLGGADGGSFDSGVDPGARLTGKAADDVQGKCVCKPGPPLPASDTLKNVLVIGDSVSIGYTPAVTELLADIALVQHAPWGGDGGAEETAYGLQCVEQWLYSPNGTAYIADLVYFNFGLHDGPQLFDLPPANVTIPGQEGNMSVYEGQLAGITQKLQTYSAKTGAKLLFAITSPMMADLRADQDVSELNRRAARVMAAAGVPTVDLHAAIEDDWLANSTVAPAIRALL